MMFNTRTLASTLFAFCSLMIASRPAQCAENVIQASADAFIVSMPDGATSNYGTEPLLFTYLEDNSKVSTVVKFDLPISRAKIFSARLRMWSDGWNVQYNPSYAPMVYALKSPWKEDTVSWYQANPDRAWTRPGGDVVSDSAGDTVFGFGSQLNTVIGQPMMMEWDVTRLVRLWNCGALNNYGFRIDSSYDALVFESRECPNRNLRPTLVIEWAK